MQEEEAYTDSFHTSAVTGTGTGTASGQSGALGTTGDVQVGLGSECIYHLPAILAVRHMQWTVPNVSVISATCTFPGQPQDASTLLGQTSLQEVASASSLGGSRLVGREGSAISARGAGPSNLGKQASSMSTNTYGEEDFEEDFDGSELPGAALGLKRMCQVADRLRHAPQASRRSCC